MTINLNSEKIINDIINDCEELLDDTNDANTFDEDSVDEILYCDEDDLLEEMDDYFEYQIKSRGKKYYEDGNVILCCKIDGKNKYYAKVRGSNEKPYIVSVENTFNDVLLNCTCPCDFPCKHEYAVLIAISNREYFVSDLKPEIKKKKSDLKSVLELIPSEEIKDYLLSSKGIDSVCFEMNTFENYFRKYYPNQEYEYYYNNLYNSLSLDNEYEEMTDSYLNMIKQYISGSEYEESLKIIISIINAYNDTNKLNFDDYIVTKFPLIGMYFRIINRKCDEKVKQDLLSFILELKEKNYYNNLFLEDIVFMINN